MFFFFGVPGSLNSTARFQILLGRNLHSDGRVLNLNTAISFLVVRFSSVKIKRQDRKGTLVVVSLLNPRLHFRVVRAIHRMEENDRVRLPLG